MRTKTQPIDPGYDLLGVFYVDTCHGLRVVSFSFPGGFEHKPNDRLPLPLPDWEDPIQGGGETSDPSTGANEPLNLWDSRANAVKDAFVYAYEGYTKHAEGYDELLPIKGGRVNNFNGWGTTLFDALDTMWIMGLDDKFQQSLVKIAKCRFHLKPTAYAPFFETVIRTLGGLLSGYALSNETVLLTRADDLGRMLLPAFNTTFGLPMFAVNTVSGDTKMGWSPYVLWSEALSNQMEYKYLAHLTGRAEYYEKSERIMEHMRNASLPNGLYPSWWDRYTGAPTNHVYTVGAFADSAYEYLLKQWLLTGRSEPKALEMYLSSAKGIIGNLLHLTPGRNLLYVTDVSSGPTYYPSHTLEHLSCFLPGLLALGVHGLPESILNGTDRELHAWAAEGLAETCWATYADTPTGLGPDEVSMKAWLVPHPANQGTPTTTASEEGPALHPRQEPAETGTQTEHPSDDPTVAIGSRWIAHVDKWDKDGRIGGKPPGTKVVVPEPDPEKRDWILMKDGYLLRPETIESFYVLWKTTGQVRWRERGWAIFQSIEKHAKTQHGYASVLQVDTVSPTWKDEMPSFFLAETLKYLYLLFSEEDLIPFNRYVFNTEAHPLPVFEWAPWEKEDWGIGNSTIDKPSRTKEEDLSP
ncbi:mannosyl-oligosaccharide alpha-1,2-mannosidase [Coprinopsis sp. MPI-PUGE-AT-0042]|nr:mannosyl-oligosaccharide alpha-1,2-mannosidase [Coprinopsis sp. MPI-PUGE-AT-0042]